MNLQGRNLSQGMTGDDVLLLKIELALLDFNVFGQPQATHVRTQWPAVDEYTPTVAAAVRELQERCDLPQTGIVDKATAQCINAAVEETGQYVVFGRVFGPDNESLPGVLVELLERDLPSLEVEGPRVLAESETGPTGYIITYTPEQFTGSEALPPRPDLQVRLPEIVNDNGEQLTSSIYYNSPRIQIIYVHLDHVQTGQLAGAKSEWERNQERTNQAAGNWSPDRWTDEDITFLASETEIPYEQVRFLHLDALWSYQHEVELSVFYGILRQGGGPRLRQILTEKPERNRQRLKAAFDANTIPAHLRQLLDEILEMLAQRAVEVLFTTPADDEEGPGLGQIVGTAPIDEELQQRFVAFSLHHQDEDGFWERLADEEDGFDEETVNALQFTLTAGSLVGGNLNLLATIQDRKEAESWQLPRDIAHLSQQDWSEITGDETEAKEIAGRVDRAFPTAVVAFRVTPELEDNDLTNFFAANSEFDLNAPIDAQLESGVNLDGVQNLEQLRSNIMTLRRTMAIAPDQQPQVMQALIRENLTSSLSISQMGKSTFIETMSPAIGAEVANETYHRSIDRLRDTSMIVQQLRDYMTEQIRVIPSVEVEDELPTWARLFGSLNACACEHCRSMYSPAAYMVDLLQFLKDAPGRPNPLTVLIGTRPYDGFDGRRPDLAHIKLNCANTNTTMPYIDLVNEILEEAIAPVDPVPMPGESASPAEREAYQQWLARYQTPEANGETQEEIEQRLRAEPDPVHEHGPAYERLLIEYPWNLPFHPDWERVQLFSRHLGLDLYEVRRLFFPKDEGTLARYQLGLSQAQWDILARPVGDVDEVTAAWGTSLEVLEQVSIFLQQSQLSFAELEILIVTDFLSARGRAVTINRELDPCDIEQFRLEGLRDTVGIMDHYLLEQLHRFLRFCQYLDWSVETLDTVLYALGHTEIGAPAIMDVTRVSRMAEVYGVTASYLVTATGETLAKLMCLTEREAGLFATLISVSTFDGLHTLDTQDRLNLLEAWRHFIEADIDIRKLDYILTGQDETPPAFRPTEDALRAFLRELHDLVQTELAKADDFPPDRVPIMVGNIIVENLARALDLPVDVMSRLIQNTVDNDAGNVLEAIIKAQSTISTSHPEAAIEDIRAFTEINAPAGEPDLVDPAIYSNAYLLLERLDRVAYLLHHLEIDRRELDAIESTRVDNKFLDLNQIRTPDLPPDVPLHELYDQWLRLVEARQLQRAMPLADEDLFDFLVNSADTETDWLDYVNEHTGWDLDPVTGQRTSSLGSLLRALEGLDTSDPLDTSLFQKIDTYRRLYRAVQWLRRYRIDPRKLILWADKVPENVGNVANSLRKVAYERHSSDESWYKVLTPLMDELRETKRDALLAYLIHQRSEFSTSADVYEEYLIDPEMSSCMLTSRIKQANATLQLFVQRILMNLEVGLRAPERDSEAWQAHWKQWESMKNYRVWEANRKVFLYPENWIYPELRDNRSVFFRVFQNELLQDEVNQGTIERAYHNYLRQLLEVARPDVRALYHESEDDTLHVIARTHSTPHSYYYCRRLANQDWTGWERIEAGIEGDHLIPVIQDGRLLLFWPTFREVIHNDRAWVEINLSWSERNQRGWSAKRSSRQNAGIMEQPIDGIFASPSQYLFRLDHESDHLDILMYKQIHDESWSGFISTFSMCTHLFRFDDCTGHMAVFKLASPRVFLHPSRTQANNNSLQEDGSRGDWMSILHGDISDDTITDPTLLLGIRELATTGGLGGVLLAIALAAAANEGLADFHARLHEISAGITFQPTLLESTALNRPGQFQLVPPHQTRQFLGEQPFFFKHQDKTYLVNPVDVTLGFGPFEGESHYYRFETFFHPFICDFIERLDQEGFSSLLAPPESDPLARQQLGETRASTFKSLFHPTLWVMRDQPRERINFDLSDAYGLYNWEIFFHIPLLVATRLSENGRFEEAQHWFHYIFDPTDTSPHDPPARFWRVKPFFKLAENPPGTLSELLQRIAAEATDALDQVAAWRDDRFNPHHIARLRNVAYMKTTVMKYLDNLIAWGDHLFQQDTMESINEAIQIYILTAEILGPKPVIVEEQELPTFSYAEITTGGDHLDELSNAWLELEGLAPVDVSLRTAESRGAGLPLHPYFCIPANDKLLSYWDTVADRLFKTRHCMNIEGQVRQLPLFEPPIDPALLVRARASGLDLRSILDLVSGVPIPQYRYAIMYSKALEFCNEVRSLGNALLSALEKKDAEELALLRSRHEESLLSQVRFIREQQVQESNEALKSLNKTQDIVSTRVSFYDERLTDQNKKRISEEKQQFEKLAEAQEHQYKASEYERIASAMHILPNISSGANVSVSFGGSNLGSVFNAFANLFRFDSGEASYQANRASLEGTFKRREEEWGHQFELALTEREQVDKQIAAADIRLAIAEQERDNHQKQLDQAREAENFLRSKFSNQELYGWMVGLLASLHHQAYKLAVELARKAQRAAQHELGLSASDFQFISVDPWDSVKKGLLAGERLSQELRQMDAAYMEQNERRLEITKNISLSMLNPHELIRLRETGVCQIYLPEVLFDLDFPGHFNRRIKSVSLTIPCVIGPYTSVSASLTLEQHAVRQEAGLDPLTINAMSPQKSVATSSAQNDSGLFELNFRDERFLPFEGFGAISVWKLELPTPSGFPVFDYDTISDVILHLSYTALDGRDQIVGVHGESRSFRDTVQSQLVAEINAWLDSLAETSTPLTRLISLRQEFSSQFQRFLHPITEATMHETELQIERRLFPHFLQREELDMQEIFVVIKPREKGNYGYFDGHPVELAPAPLPPPDPASPGQFLMVDPTEVEPNWGGLPIAQFPGMSGSPFREWGLRLDPTAFPAELTIEMEGQQRLNRDIIEDILLVLQYEIVRT